MSVNPLRSLARGGCCRALLPSVVLVFPGCAEDAERVATVGSTGWECPWSLADADPLSLDLARAVAANGGNGGGVIQVSGTGGVRQDEAAGSRWDDGPDMQLDDAYEVASVTKAVTATLTLRLMEERALDVDAPYADLLPQWGTGMLVIDGVDRTGEITIRQLLAHRSGLPDYWTDPPFVSPGENEFLREFLNDPDRHWEPEEMLDLARTLTPIGEPGVAFHYSDTNYVILGLLLEQVAGQALHDAMREWVFDPLGMDDTWMSFHEAAVGDRTLSHRYEGAWDMTVHEHQSADWAGGGLVSTSHDLRQLLCGLAEGGVYRESSTIDTMMDWAPTGDADIAYGLGLYSVMLDGERRLWGHDGYGSAFAYILEGSESAYVGTLNQTESDWWPLIAPDL